MSTVVMHAVVSVDGFIADENDEVGPLFDWYFNGTEPIVAESLEDRHAPFRVSAASLSYVRPFWDSIRATIQGRHLFDLTNGWEAQPPAGEHLLVVSHRPKPAGWHPEADVPFFDDVAAAVGEARRRAGDGVVRSAPVTSAATPSPSGSSTWSRWTWCRSCSVGASGTSVTWTDSNCWGTPT